LTNLDLDLAAELLVLCLEGSDLPFGSGDVL